MNGSVPHKRFSLTTTAISLVLGALLTLSTCQRSQAPCVPCVVIVFAAAAGIAGWAIHSCDAPWRCWCVPNDHDNPLAGCATNFPSQICWKVGIQNGWFAAHNLTYKSAEACRKAICSTNLIPLWESSGTGTGEIIVSDGPTHEGPWAYLTTLNQSPEDLCFHQRDFEALRGTNFPSRFFRFEIPEGTAIKSATR